MANRPVVAETKKQEKRIAEGKGPKGHIRQVTGAGVDVQFEWFDYVASMDAFAAGQIDAVIESDVNILDIAALVVIVREAGGVFTDLDGNDPGLDTTSVLAAAPGLHGELLDRMRA